jgi:hypothetical protein
MQPGKMISFVFRRRGTGQLNANLHLWAVVVQPQNSKAAPRRRKTKEFRSDRFFYKQATPTGLGLALLQRAKGGTKGTIGER